MKKLSSLLIISIAAICLLISASVFVMADTYGDFEYSTQIDGVVLTKYNGKAAEVDIPNKIDGKAVVSIGEECFAGNIHITKVTIPSSVTEIGEYAFEACGKLKTVVFNEGLETIDKGAFSGCSTLVNAELPDGLETIGPFAFFLCQKLESVTIPSSVETLERAAFSDSGLKTLVIPDDTKLTSISDRAFYDCKLTSIELPANIKTVGTKAFMGSSKATSIVLKGVETIGKSAFETLGGSGEDQQRLNLELSAATIGERAFAGRLFDSLVLKEGVKSIGAEAFAYAGNDTRGYVLKLPASLENIAEGALSNCHVKEYEIAAGNLNYVVKDGVIFTEDEKTLVAFPALKEGAYAVPAGTTEIAGGAFGGACVASGLTLPEGLKTIGKGAFKQASLSNVELTIPSSVTDIKENAFEYATLKKLTLGAGTDSIKYRTFFKSNINNIVLPEGIKNIGQEAFAHSSSSCELPKSIETVGQAAFMCATGTYSITSGGDYEIIGDAAEYKFLVMNDGSNKEVVAFLLQGNSTPVSIEIPDGITSIRDYAITANNPNLQNITIPSSVTKMGEFSVGYVQDSSKMNLHNYGLEVSNYSDIESIGLRLATIYTSSEAARNYARENAIACFTATPSQNITTCTLAGDESTQLVISNANLEDITFTSSDSSIATVDANGIITGQRKGTTNVVAAVGHKYFVCDVTVTSNAANPYVSSFDESKYKKVTCADYNDWFNSYVEYNGDNISTSAEESMFIDRYKNANDFLYYEAIWSVQSDDPMHISQRENVFGDDYEETSQMLAHGLIKELNRYKSNEDLILYSGTDDLDIICDMAHPNIPALKQEIGKTRRFDLTTSTSVDETVPMGFGDYVLIIYTDKEALNGGYIDASFGSCEYEMLLNEGLEIKILDVGVRYVSIEHLNGSGSINHFERYVKVYLSAQNGGGGSNKPVDTGDYNNALLYTLLVIVAIVFIYYIKTEKFKK